MRKPMSPSRLASLWLASLRLASLRPAYPLSASSRLASRRPDLSPRRQWQPRKHLSGTSAVAVRSRPSPLLTVGPLSSVCSEKVEQRRTSLLATRAKVNVIEPIRIQTDRSARVSLAHVESARVPSTRVEPEMTAAEKMPPTRYVRCNRRGVQVLDPY